MGKLTDYTVLDNSFLSNEEQSLAAGSVSQKQESRHMDNTAFYSIRDQAQVRWYLKGYWVKKKNVLPQQTHKNTCSYT